jgi:hypothetical protein
MELMLAFYPSLAIAICIATYSSCRWTFIDGCAHGERMYALGKRHGREEASLEAYRLSLRLRGISIDDDDE